MAAQLVFAGAHRLRYLIDSISEAPSTSTITTIGLASPDTLTDSVGSGVIKQESKVVAQGYAQFGPGGQTIQKMEALWSSDYTSADPSPGSPFGQKIPPTATCKITGRTGTATWVVDQNAAAPNSPTIIVTGTGVGTAYLDIEVPGTIGA